MAIWNDTDIPLAYLITFRTYGTWLHGDDGGSIDRYHNAYLGPKVEPNHILKMQQRVKLKGDPVILNNEQRTEIESAIKEVCAHRKWLLRAINVRTNHIHTVVSIGPLKPFRALNAFKAYSTRRVRKTGCWKQEYSPWADKGRERWLWNETSIWNACDYVINGQGDDLRDFDNWKEKSLDA